MDQEIHLKVLRELEENPDITQRQLAQQLGIDHNRLTFPFQGLDNKLTGVEPTKVVKDILA